MKSNIIFPFSSLFHMRIVLQLFTVFFHFYFVSKQNAKEKSLLLVLRGIVA